MKERCDWRLYINKNDRKESYFLQDRCIQGDLQKGSKIKYGFYDEYVDIELHKNMYLAATFNNEDVVTSVNLDTLHGENHVENFYSKYKNHHAMLIMLKNHIFILIETNDDELFYSGKVLVSKKAIQKSLKDLDTEQHWHSCDDLDVDTLSVHLGPALVDIDDVAGKGAESDTVREGQIEHRVMCGLQSWRDAHPGAAEGIDQLLGEDVGVNVYYGHGSSSHL